MFRHLIASFNFCDSYVDLGFSTFDISKTIGVNVRRIRYLKKIENLGPNCQYNDRQLDAFIKNLLEQYPNAGIELQYI